MRVQWIVMVAVLGLPACGDDNPPTPELDPPPPLSAYERVLASRGEPMAMTRQRDKETGISLAFPRGWQVERDDTVIYRASAPEQSAAHYAETVSVASVATDATLDEYLATLRMDTSRQVDGLQEVMSGARKIGEFDARTYRYTVPWKRGNIVHEVTLVKQDGRMCIITASCHMEGRPAFATLHSIILQSLQWPQPAPNK